jgi:hypothetical protein
MNAYIPLYDWEVTSILNTTVITIKSMDLGGSLLEGPSCTVYECYHQPWPLPTRYQRHPISLVVEPRLSPGFAKCPQRHLHQLPVDLRIVFWAVIIISNMYWTPKEVCAMLRLFNYFSQGNIHNSFKSSLSSWSLPYNKKAKSKDCRCVRRGRRSASDKMVLTQCWALIPKHDLAILPAK